MIRIVIAAAAACLSSAPALASEASGHSASHSTHCGLPSGEGSLESINVAKSKVTIAHTGIAPVIADAGTLEFAVEQAVDLSAFIKGEKVHFLLKPGKAKVYSVAMMCSAEAEAGAHDACMKAMHETAMKTSAALGMECKRDGGAHDTHGTQHH